MWAVYQTQKGQYPVHTPTKLIAGMNWHGFISGLIESTTFNNTWRPVCHGSHHGRSARNQVRYEDTVHVSYLIMFALGSLRKDTSMTPMVRADKHETLMCAGLGKHTCLDEVWRTLAWLELCKLVSWVFCITIDARFCRDALQDVWMSQTTCKSLYLNFHC